MSDKIVSLVSPENEPNESLIRCLEDILEEAKSGKLTFMISVLVYADGRTTNFWPTARSIDHAKIIGSIETLKLDYYGINMRETF